MFPADTYFNQVNPYCLVEYHNRDQPRSFLTDVLSHHKQQLFVN